MKRRIDAVFWQSLCLNSIIVLVIAVAMGGLSMMLERSSRQEEQEKSEAVLMTRLDRMTDHLTNMREYLDAVQAATALTGEPDPEAAQSYLQRMEERMPLIRRMVLTYPGADLIVAADGFHRGISQNLTYYNGAAIGAEFYASAAADRTEVFLSGTEDSADAFVYTLRLPAGTYAPAMNVVIQIDRTALMNELFPSDIGRFARAQLFVNQGERQQVAQLKGEWFDSAEFYAFDLAGAGVFAMSVQIEDGYFDSVLYIISHYLILILIATVLIGVVMAYVASTRQNKPVKNAINELSERGLLTADDRNVFNGLLHSVDILVSEKETAQKTLSSYQVQLRDNMLDRLFASTVPCPGLEENITMEFEQFPRKSIVYYCKILISGAEDTQSMEMTVMMLLEFLRKQLPENAVIHSTDALTFGLVYPMTENVAAVEREVEKVLRDVPNFFSAQVVAVSGGTCDSIAAIGMCYERAQLSYYASSERRAPRQVILAPDDPLAIDEGLQLRPLQTMYQYMATGDSEHAVAALETFFVCPTDVQLIDIRERYCALKVQILLASREIAPNSPMPEIPSFRISDPAEMQLEVLSSAVRQVSGYVQQRQSSVRDDQFTSLMEFLHTHYSDSSLCAASLADEFRVSEKYLFSLFKKQTGYSPISYLHRIRMQQAAKLLVESDLTAQEISEQVGFANFGTFHKAFKREYGLAPSKYRESAVHT